MTAKCHRDLINVFRLPLCYITIGDKCFPVVTKPRKKVEFYRTAARRGMNVGKMWSDIGSSGPIIIHHSNGLRLTSNVSAHLSLAGQCQCWSHSGQTDTVVSSTDWIVIHIQISTTRPVIFIAFKTPIAISKLTACMGYHGFLSLPMQCPLWIVVACSKDEPGTCPLSAINNLSATQFL